MTSLIERIARMDEAINYRLTMLELPTTFANRLVYLKIIEEGMMEIPNLTADDEENLKAVRKLIEEAVRVVNGE